MCECACALTWQDNIEDRWQEQKSAGEEAGEQEVDEQGKPLTKKARQQLKRAAEKERARQREAQQDRMEPQVCVNTCCCWSTGCQEPLRVSTHATVGRLAAKNLSANNCVKRCCSVLMLVWVKLDSLQLSMP